MSFFQWLEATAIADWVRTSYYGWPLMLYMHSLGMGILLGLIFLLNLRLLGLFPRVPVAAISSLFGLFWVAFAVNIVGGTGIFISQAPYYAGNTLFLVKMGSLVLGAIVARALQRCLVLSSGSDLVISPRLRSLSWLSLLFWATALITGRLTAYI